MSHSELKKQLKHVTTRGGVLVPLIEDFMRAGPVDISTPEDVAWLESLLKTMQARENRRTNDTPVFSPSALASCLRQVYLLRHHKELEIPKAKTLRIEPHFYFLKGNFIHLQWQYVLYKMEKFYNDPDVFELWGVEVPILSKRKDHGGTVDAIFTVYGEGYIGDFKGVNVRTFGEITRGYVPPQYELQLTDYMMLWNAQKTKPFRIEEALLLAENKGGPDNKHPIALHEWNIEMTDHLPEVRRRLEVLREYEKENSIPPIECESTKTFQFTGCAFNKFCKGEVKAVEEKRRAKDSETEITVARPKKSKRGNKR